MSALLEELRVLVSSRGCDIRVEVSGAVDIASVDVLRNVLDAAIVTGAGDVDVHMEHTSFCDSVGLFTLLDARRRLGDRGRGLRVVDASHTVVRLLQLTGTDDLLGGPGIRAGSASRPAGASAHDGI